MKKTMALCLCLLLCIGLLGCAAPAPQATPAVDAVEGLSVLTSFYPMYLLTSAVCADTPAHVTNMAVTDTGCLHDYQLTVNDMVALDGADLFVINGAGMESFLEKALRSDLTVVDASDGLSALPLDEGHDHGESNAHLWLDPLRAMAQTQAIAAGLAAADPANAAAYSANAELFCEELQALHDENKALLAPYAGCKVISFHEGFAYFCDAYGLQEVAVFASDEYKAPSAQEVAAMIEQVRQGGVQLLLVPAGGDSIADSVVRETGVALCVLDPITAPAGQSDPTQAYQEAQRQNARAVAEALR